MSVRVSARFRPLNKAEIAAGGQECARFKDDKSVEVYADATEQGGHGFELDRVFAPGCSQIEVYEHVARPLVSDVLQGYNCTIFAYGQTGSGKTHTVVGESKAPEGQGIIPQAASEVFALVGVSANDEDQAIEVNASYIEIYMEKIFDLLNPDEKINLRVREDKVKGIWVEGVNVVPVSDAKEAMAVFHTGNGCRAVGAHLMNEHSSRSHAIFILAVLQRNLRDNVTIAGKLYCVDLAGSETVRKTQAEGQRLEEAKHINKSLSALGLVIKALTDSKTAKHIPYRDSKLTRVLQDSLGGNAKTSLIVTCSCSLLNIHETIASLRFGMCAQHIKNKPRVNTERSIGEYKQRLKVAEQVLGRLTAHIAMLEGGPSMQLVVQWYRQEQRAEAVESNKRADKKLEDGEMVHEGWGYVVTQEDLGAKLQLKLLQNGCPAEVHAPAAAPAPTAAPAAAPAPAPAPAPALTPMQIESNSAGVGITSPGPKLDAHVMAEAKALHPADNTLQQVESGDELSDSSEMSDSSEEDGEGGSASAGTKSSRNSGGGKRGSERRQAMGASKGKVADTRRKSKSDTAKSSKGTVAPTTPTTPKAGREKKLNEAQKKLSDKRADSRAERIARRGSAHKVSAAAAEERQSRRGRPVTSRPPASSRPPTSRSKSGGPSGAEDMDACSVCGGQCGEVGRRGGKGGKGKGSKGAGGDQLLLFTCDGNCGSYFHPCCVGLEGLPEDGEWFCKPCTSSAAKGAGSADEEKGATQIESNGGASGGGRGRGGGGGLGGLDLKAVARDLLALKAELVGMKREKQALEARWRIERQLNASMDVRKVESRRKMNTELSTLRVEVEELRETNVELVVQREEWKEAKEAIVLEGRKEKELQKQAREQQLQQQLDSRDQEVRRLKERLREYETNQVHSERVHSREYETQVHSERVHSERVQSPSPREVAPEEGMEGMAGGGGTSAARSLAHARARARTSLAQQPATSPTAPSRLTPSTREIGFMLKPLQTQTADEDDEGSGGIGRSSSVPVGLARSPTAKQSMVEATAPRMACSPTHMVGGKGRAASDQQLPWPMPDRTSKRAGYEIPKRAPKGGGGLPMAPTSPLLSTRTLNNSSFNNTISGFPMPLGGGGASHGLARPSTAGERAQAMKARLHSLLDSLQD
jgi:kinesin family protein 5